MANFIQGDAVTFDALIYGNGNNSGQSFMQSLSGRFQNAVHQTVMPMFNNLANTAFEAISVSKGMDRLRAIGYKMDNIFNPYQINYLDNLIEIQQANLAMRGWIMACPEALRAYSQSMIAGYDELYEDPEPGLLDEARYDYRRVTDGIWMERPNKEMESWRFYGDADSADELDFSDQVDILLTWDTLKIALAEAQGDPTSSVGASM